MTKEQALQEIANHLNLLIDYDVINATLGDTLFENLERIVNGIDQTQDTYDEQANVLNLWENVKNEKGNDFDTP